VAEKISWSVDGAALKTYLGISGEGEDSRLEPWLEAAIEQADLYMARDFVPVYARYTIKSGVGEGDKFEIVINGITTSYTANATDTLTDVAEQLRDLLEISLASEDVDVSGTYASVLISSDADHLNTAFVCDSTYTADQGSSGIIETVKYSDIPANVRLGVYEYVRALRTYYNRSPGTRSVKTGALSESYDEHEATALAIRAAKGYWRHYKTNILLDGKV